MEKQKRVPALRFPEFVGDWEMKRLGDITVKVNSGKTPLGGESVYVTNGILFIRSQNISDNRLSMNNATYITEEVNATMKNSVVQPKDILLNITGASLGRSAVVPTDFTIGNVNQHVCIVRFDANHEPYFIQPIFSSERGQKLFDSLQVGGGREGLNFQSIKEIKLSFPTLPEQQKIATFLTSVDEKLTQLKKKKTLLEQYKKGAMQQILSRFSGLGDEQDGTNPPILQSSKSRFRQLRFKDDNGNEYPEWEEKRLGEIAEIVMGQSPESNSYNSDGLGMPLIQGNADIQNRLSYPRNWTTQSTKRCKIGDLILTVRAPVGAVAKSVHNAYIGRGVCAIRNNSLSNIEFIYQVLLDYELKWIRLEQGSTFTAVSGADIKSIEISIPSLPEQTKIANFLSALDEKIAHCGGQIEKMEQWKKGLLQGMFC